MSFNIELKELLAPSLEFGGAAVFSDPKVGLEDAGPYDLRFGGARKNEVRVGIIGPKNLVDSGLKWLERCSNPILGFKNTATPIYQAYAGFESIFRAKLVINTAWQIVMNSDKHDPIEDALQEVDDFLRFSKTLELYVEALKRLASRDTARPDVVVVCLSEELFKRIGTINRNLTSDEKKTVKKLQKKKQETQLDMFGVFQEVEQTQEDFLNRDFRAALKAEAMKLRMPIQIGREKLFNDRTDNEEPARRAWNSMVALYYKAGGVPWRLRNNGPETCFVGISFHHFRTTQRAIVRSSLAQAFSSDGEGFAVRGESVPWEKSQGRNVHLSESQAYNLAISVIDEYRSRTGGSPLRVVIHKTSTFDDNEYKGFRAALSNTPVVELVTLIPSPLRLVRFGDYPPTYGTFCQINKNKSFLFTSGFMPELGTYPGPHVPQPFEVRVWGDGKAIDAARDILNLTRMNWNTADIRGKWPVTLSFARRVGKILDEFGDQPAPVSSFRYFL